MNEHTFLLWCGDYSIEINESEAKCSHLKCSSKIAGSKDKITPTKLHQLNKSYEVTPSKSQQRTSKLQ